VSLLTAAQAAFTAILSAAANAAVSVSYKGVTATGLRDTSTQGTRLVMDGNAAETTGRVRVRCDQIGLPAQGDTLTVDGDTVYALDVRTDPVGALYTIEFSKSRPYEGAT
jgi:hypothetical protein